MALRDVRIQLEIDTGSGTLCPCTDDYFITAEAMRLYNACGIELDELNKTTGLNVAVVIGERLDQLHIRDPKRQLLVDLLHDCLTHTSAFLAVIEVSA